MTNNEVISIFDRGKPISSLEFAQQILSDETSQKVSKSIARLLKKRRYQAALPYPILNPDPPRSNQKLKYGTLFHDRPKGSNETMLVVDGGFPEFFRRQAVSREDALGATSVYAFAYGAIVSKILWKQKMDRTIPVHPDSFQREVWPLAMASMHQIEPYRAAACVLQAVSKGTMSTLEGLLPSGPLPMHLAGIRNPLSPEEFIDYRDILE